MTDPISVNGLGLDGAKASPAFTAIVAPSAGQTYTKFILDGVYQGQVKTPPYQWVFTDVSVGDHRLEARWDGPTAGSVRDNFTVSATGGGPVTPPSPPPVVYNLQAALDAAKPGDIIRVPAGTYTGTFTASASGTVSNPIILDGDLATITAGSLTGGYGLHITGSYWRVVGLTVAKSGKGIVLDGSIGTVLSRVDVGDIGNEGVHFRKGSAGCALINSHIHDTGKDTPGFGEGVYIGSANSNWSSIMGSSSTPDPSNGVVIIGNSIADTAAEGIDIKEGTSGGLIIGNTFSNAGYSGSNYADSWVDVKGNGYLIIDNFGVGALLDAFQVHNVIPGWGNGNVFSNNTVTSVPGYQYRVDSSSVGTIIEPQETGADLGLSNIATTG